MSEPRGLLVVLSGASGVGKTAIAARLMRMPQFARTVTATTRAPRAAERDGVDYHFLTDAAFREKIARGEFLEHAQVHGRLYGTPREAVRAIVDQGLVCLLVIDVQGAATLRRNKVEGRFVFVAPPSEEELERRLRGRGTDSPAAISQRLANARHEMAQSASYDAVVINDDLDRAVREIAALVSAWRQ